MEVKSLTPDEVKVPMTLHYGNITEYRGGITEEEELATEPMCEYCEDTGEVTIGEYDDIRTIKCPHCSIDDSDFTGATEGDR